jgi:hypothetical protein
LLDDLLRAEAEEQVAILTFRSAHDNPYAVAQLLDALRTAGAEQQASALLTRDPAAHATLDDPGGVGELLLALLRAGAEEQADALLARDPAAHAFDNLGSGVVGGFLLARLVDAPA